MLDSEESILLALLSFHLLKLVWTPLLWALM